MCLVMKMISFLSNFIANLLKITIINKTLIDTKRLFLGGEKSEEVKKIHNQIAE